LHFDVAADAVERWSELLLGAGAQSIDVADPHEGPIDESPLYDESGGDAPQWWPVSRITALFGGARELDQALNALAAERARCRRTRPIRFRIGIGFARRRHSSVRCGSPSACGSCRRGAIPSMRMRSTSCSTRRRVRYRFASDDTTVLALASRELRGGESVLDYGCGSGILAIAACRLERSASSAPTSIRRRSLQAKRTPRTTVCARSFVCARIDSLRPRWTAVRCDRGEHTCEPVAGSSRQRLHCAPKAGGRIVLSGISMRRLRRDRRIRALV
jgi:hypothetical protein